MNTTQEFLEMSKKPNGINIQLTPDQVSIVESSLKSSLKYSDSEYIELVDEIIQVIKEFKND